MINIQRFPASNSSKLGKFVPKLTIKIFLRNHRAGRVICEENCSYFKINKLANNSTLQEHIRCMYGSWSGKVPRGIPLHKYRMFTEEAERQDSNPWFNRICCSTELAAPCLTRLVRFEVNVYLKYLSTTETLTSTGNYLHFMYLYVMLWYHVLLSDKKLIETPGYIQDIALFGTKLI